MQNWKFLDLIRTRLFVPSFQKRLCMKQNLRLAFIITSDPVIILYSRGTLLTTNHWRSPKFTARIGQWLNRLRFILRAGCETVGSECSRVTALVSWNLFLRHLHGHCHGGNSGGFYDFYILLCYHNGIYWKTYFF